MFQTLYCRAFLATLLVCSYTSASPQNLAITGANVYAAPDAIEQKDVTVIIRDGFIDRVGRRANVPKGVPTIHCSGCTVVAGFWNSHTHFVEPQWQGAESLPADRLTKQISDMVSHSGFTTVVDTGSDTENTIALRQRIESGEVSGPRIFTAGIPLFPAHALPYYLSELPPDLVARMAQPENEDQATKAVDSNRSAGADIVKLFTGSIVTPRDITPMRLPIAHAAVREAHQYGQLVFAHPSNLAGTKVAIEAGVDVLAHTPEVTDGIDDGMLKQMIARGMTIVPTLMLFSKDQDIAKIRELDFRYHKLGGRLVYGTDTGFLRDYDQAEEYRQLKQAGFDFRDVLAMLTTAPTELFHLSEREGKVSPGMRGDLTILGQDPSSGDPLAFTKVLYTIRHGVIVWDSTKHRVAGKDR